MDKINK